MGLVWWCGVCSRWTDLGVSWFGYFLVVLGGFVWFCCACGSVLVWVVVLVFVCDFRCGLLRCRPSGVVLGGLVVWLSVICVLGLGFWIWWFDTSIGLWVLDICLCLASLWVGTV